MIIVRLYCVLFYVILDYECYCCVWFCWLFEYLFCFFFKQKTAYEMRISDWSSDVCSSDLLDASAAKRPRFDPLRESCHQSAMRFPPSPRSREPKFHDCSTPASCGPA